TTEPTVIENRRRSSNVGASRSGFFSKSRSSCSSRCTGTTAPCSRCAAAGPRSYQLTELHRPLGLGDPRRAGGLFACGGRDAFGLVSSWSSHFRVSGSRVVGLRAALPERATVRFRDAAEVAAPRNSTDALTRDGEFPQRLLGDDQRLCPFGSLHVTAESTARARAEPLQSRTCARVGAYQRPSHVTRYAIGDARCDV